MQSSQSNQTTESSFIQQQNTATFYLENISNMSVDEIIMRYQNNTELLYNTLLAKAEEDKRRATVEVQQAEQARIQSMFIDYEINMSNKEYVSSSSSICSSNANTMNTDIDDNHDLYIAHPFITDSLHILSCGNEQSLNQPHSPFASDIYLGTLQQHQDIGSSSAPFFASISPNDNTTVLVNNELPDTSSHFNGHQSLGNNRPAPSCSTPTASSVNKIIKKSTSNTNSKTSGNTAIIKLKSGRSIVHRTLSYECVMNLKEYNTKIMDELNKKNDQENNKRRSRSLSSEPLDHNKVMEALRAKLKRCSSSSRKIESSTETPSSSSPPPPPNVHPTTGVLLLDLKSRKRKSSVASSWSRSKSVS